MKEKTYSIIIPAYNEEKRLLATLKRMEEYFESKEDEFEIIIVDDGSTDTTLDIIKEFRRNKDNISYVTYKENKGKGHAVRKGILHSSGSFVLFSDADQSCPIEEIEKISGALHDGYDIALGSRGLRDSNILVYQPFYRRTMGKIFNLLVQILVMRGIKDTQCGFKIFTKKAAKKIFSLCIIDGFSFDVEALYIGRKLGFKSKEVPVTWINSEASRVHPLKHSFLMIKEILQVRWNALRGRYDKKTMLRGQ